MTELAKKQSGQIKETPVNRMKILVGNKQVKEMFNNSLGDNAGAFTSSLIELYSDPSSTLKDCEASEVMMVALNAATLKLPINKNLGFAYIIPFNKNEKINGEWVKVPHPQLQIGYKGFIQLAMRSGQYKTINSNIIYEGMEVTEDYLTGEIKITGKKESDIAIGYFSYFKLVNGFEKVVYWTKEKVIDHAKRFSQGYQSMLKAKEGKYYNPEKFVWDINFDDMALKTVTKRLLSKYGVLSTEMQQAMMADTDTEIMQDIATNANMLELDTNYEEVKELKEKKEEKTTVDEDTGEIIDGQQSAFTHEEVDEMVNKVPF